jgi:CRP-like cAMP-binding protein
MQNIRVYLDQFVQLSDAEWDVFSSKLEKTDYRKRTIIRLKGEIENQLLFIDSGIIRYYLEKEDTQYTLGFAFAQEFACAYDSFLTQEPARYHVEALSDIVAWRISYADLQLAYKETKNGNVVGRILAEKLFMDKFSKEINLKHQSAEERYMGIIKDKPHFLKGIPLQYIASYIGVTPQTLSKIRKRIS